MNRPMTRPMNIAIHLDDQPLEVPAGTTLDEVKGREQAEAIGGEMEGAGSL